MKRPKMSRRALHLKRMDEQARTSRKRRATGDRTGWIGWRRDEPPAERLHVPMLPDEHGYYWIW